MKLTRLREEFSMVSVTREQSQQHIRAYILHLIGTQLFLDYSTNKIYLRWLLLLEDFDACRALSWGSAMLAILYRSLYKISMMRTSQFSGHSTLLQYFG